MLQFNNLEISEDKKYLIIDVQVQEGDYFSNIELGNIYINTQDEFKESGPVESKISTFNIQIDDTGRKYYRNYIDLDGTDSHKTLYFVWVTANGEVSEDAPCCLKKGNCILGVVYNKQLLYTLGMKYFNSMSNCTVSGEVLDYILRNKAFEINLKTGNYYKAIEYWKTLYSTPNSIKTNKCGCYGTI